MSSASRGGDADDRGRGKDLVALFILEDLHNDLINLLLEQAREGFSPNSEGEDEYYLWLADRYNTLPTTRMLSPEGTEPPIDDNWTSPFLGKSLSEVAAFVAAAPRPLNRELFVVLNPELSAAEDKVWVCRIVEGAEVQAMQCEAGGVSKVLVNHDRELWPEYWRAWQTEGRPLQ